MCRADLVCFLPVNGGVAYRTTASTAETAWYVDTVSDANSFWVASDTVGGESAMKLENRDVTLGVGKPQSPIYLTASANVVVLASSSASALTRITGEVAFQYRPRYLWAR